MPRRFSFVRFRKNKGGDTYPVSVPGGLTLNRSPTLDQVLFKDVMTGYERKIFLTESDSDLRMLVNDVVHAPLTNEDKDILLKQIDRRYDELRERKAAGVERAFR